MKQAFSSGKGEVKVFDVPVPGRLRDAVLVKNAFSVISSGTEGAEVSSRGGILGVYEQARSSRDKVNKAWNLVLTQGVKTAYEKVQDKLADFKVMGYTSAGTVVEVENESMPFEPGARVACMGAGLANHAEYVAVPKNLVVTIPGGVGFEQASFAALGCIALQGIRRLELTPGERIGVIGLGLIGQICIRILNALGYEAFGIDLQEAKAGKAREVEGVSSWSTASVDSITRIMEDTGGMGLDGVVIAAATKGNEPVNMAFDVCRKRGRVSVVGDVGLGLDRSKMYRKEIELRLSCSYGPGRYDSDYEMAGRDYPFAYVRWTERRNLELFLNLLKSGRVSVSPLISATYQIDQAAEAYATVKKGDPGTFGVLFDYGHSEQDVPELPTDARTVRQPAPKKSIGAGKIKIGLIGVGDHAKEVLVPALRRLANRYEIVGVASRSGATAGVAATRFRAQIATSDYKELLSDAEINAVFIATRHSTHARMTMDALESGKHVFVEKPLAITVDDAQKIVERSEASGLIVRVGFNRRFSPYLAAMRDAVGSSGRRIFSARVNPGNIGDHWSNTLKEGGRILGEGVHFLDLCNWFIGSEPESLSSTCSGPVDRTNPNVSVQISYPDGSLGRVLYTDLGDKTMGKEYFEAFGNGASARSDDYGTFESTGNTRTPRRRDRGDKGHVAELEEFAAAIQGKPYPVQGSDARSGLVATWMALSAFSSAETGTVIRMDI